MAHCFDAYNKKENRYKKLQNKKLILFDSIDIELNIDKEKLNNILKKILTQFCEINVIGYKEYIDTYWCKIHKNNNTILYLELILFKIDLNKTIVNIKHIIGDIYYLNLFIKNFKQSIEKYQTIDIYNYMIDEI